MKVRLAACALPLLLLSGCELARVVECGPNGRFVRTDDVAWCVYTRRSATCPTALSVRHPLTWGGLACASEENDSLPSHPCLDTGECEHPGDGG